MLRRSFLCVFLFPIACAALVQNVAAQSASPLTGPVEGFTYDAPTKSFREVTGTLGSAMLGPALISELDFGSIAPLKDYGLAFQAGSAVVITALGSDQQAAQPLSGAFLVPDTVMWSGDSGTAVLSSGKGSWLQTISGLPGSPIVGPLVDVSSLGGLITSAAVNAGGTHVYFAVAGGSAGVYELAADGSFSLLMPVGQPAAVAISSDGQTVYALDSGSNQIRQLSLGDSSVQSWAPAGLNQATGLAALKDATGRQVIYVTDSKDQILTSYDAGTHEAISSTPLDFAPEAIQSLGSHSFVLRARASEGEPLWAVTDAIVPAAYFIPSAPPVVVRTPRHLPLRTPITHAPARGVLTRGMEGQ